MVLDYYASNNILLDLESARQLDNPDYLDKVYRAIFERDVLVKKDFLVKNRKVDAKHFTGFFNNRYKALESLLRNRQEFMRSTSIKRFSSGEVCFIGMVFDKFKSKNDNILLTVEDPSGSIKVVITKNNADAYENACDVCEDCVVGITGTFRNDVVFANSLVFPDVPLSRELRKSDREVCMAVISDLHVGSKNFLREEFMRFVHWLSVDEDAKKIKYVVVAGDLVDGVGIFPDQKNELDIPDIYDQYKECAKLLSMIPSDISLIIIPGNHDAIRICEPQPKFGKDIFQPLLKLPNAVFVSSPGWVNLGSSADFSGFNLLLYHGFSFSFYADTINSIKNSGRSLSDRTDLVMKYLLRCRHLAPAHGSALYVPDPDEDCLIINEVPDFFISGHIHKMALSHYRGVDIICGSCWQSISDYQEKMGHIPEPCKVPVVNLATRNIKVVDFSK